MRIALVQNQTTAKELTQWVHECVSSIKTSGALTWLKTFISVTVAHVIGNEAMNN